MARVGIWRRCLTILGRLRSAVHPVGSTADIEGLTLRTVSRTRNILVERRGALSEEIQLATDDHMFQKPKGYMCWQHTRIRGYSSDNQEPILSIIASDYGGRSGLEYTIKVNGTAERHQASLSDKDWILLYEILVALELDGLFQIERPALLGTEGDALVVKLKNPAVIMKRNVGSSCSVCTDRLRPVVRACLALC